MPPRRTVTLTPGRRETAPCWASVRSIGGSRDGVTRLRFGVPSVTQRSLSGTICRCLPLTSRAYAPVAGYRLRPASGNRLPPPGHVETDPAPGAGRPTDRARLRTAKNGRTRTGAISVAAAYLLVVFGKGWHRVTLPVAQGQADDWRRRST